MKETATGKSLLLVAEADADIGLLTRLAVRMDPDLDCLVVSTGEQLLRAADDDAGRLHAILLDPAIPDVDCMTVLDGLKKRSETATVPVIIFTAYVGRDDSARFRAAGVRGIIIKPFDPLGLAETIKRMIAST